MIELLGSPLNVRAAATVEVKGFMACWAMVGKMLNIVGNGGKQENHVGQKVNS